MKGNQRPPMAIIKPREWEMRENQRESERKREQKKGKWESKRFERHWEDKKS